MYKNDGITNVVILIELLHWFLLHPYHFVISQGLNLFVICLYALLSTGTTDYMKRETVKLNPQGAAIIKAAFIKCAKEIGISQEVLDLVKEGFYLKDEKFKKMIFCVFQESGHANAEGRVNISKGVALYPKDINMLPIYENCDKQGVDPVETTFLFFACYQDTTPVLSRL